MRSSFIDWLEEQKYRKDDVGDISRWIFSKPGFDPLELHDILDEVKGDTKKIKATIAAFAEYGIILKQDLDKVKIIKDEDLDQYKLERAVRNEDYEEAAKLRDKLNG